MQAGVRRDFCALACTLPLPNPYFYLHKFSTTAPLRYSTLANKN
ncbi:hypothetical protein HMPREF3192_00076 [Atopobium deltae]|uniref:Uncharacterized protein n=1 Tax=Atopobium deltae TaxID=1393034 RepID=A0A133XXK7_9ACTN|nr:hypothetical protein HMPREF3192_00076 [Atopobium deltae]